MTDFPWIKASASADTGNCVEMRRQGNAVEVRDSKNPAGPSLRLSPAEFAAWLHSARRNELDELA
jgi:hypothetical protein